MKLLKFIEITAADLPEQKNNLPASLARRVPTVYQLAYLAAKQALGDEDKPQAIISVARGCMDETLSFLDKLDETGFGSPKDFVFSTHNSLGGMLAKEFSVKGANFTMCERTLSGALEIAEILDEKIIMIVEFDDANLFAEKVLPNFDNPPETAFAKVYLYSK